MKIPYWHVDAFTSERFRGNPAGVCLLGEPLEDATMRAIAAENRHSETAFLVPSEGAWRIRWFTPTVEVDLCGHATLAAGFVVCELVEPGRVRIELESASGPLSVTRQEDHWVLDFPSRPPSPVGGDERGFVAEALGVAPEAVLAARDAVAVLAGEQDVRRLLPDFERIARLPRFALTVTAPGTSDDYVYRFFAPAQGVPEDPATGSAQSSLVPYWAERLGRSRLASRQLSTRGAEFRCEDRGPRVAIGGRAVLYLAGSIHL
jgi:PhzF family phenazine biosynthesis protein